MGSDKSKPVRIISDQPVKINAGFGFNAYIKTISDLIAFNKNKTPMTIGIYGAWGTGKTTLMKSIKQSLDKDERYNKTGSDFRKIKTMWFQPWKYGKETEILAALIEEIFQTMEQDGLFNAGKAKVEKIIKSLDGKKIFSSIMGILSGGTVNDIFAELPHKNRLGFYGVFKNFFKDLIWTYLNWQPKLGKYEETGDKKAAFVIFIDDLDRCPKERIVNVLESIKLFMDIEGCIFVLGAANEIIINALRETYKEDADNFMDKIVQVTFNLPKIPNDQFKNYLEQLKQTDGFSQDGIKEYLHLLIPALNNNPRNLKRFLNNLSLMETLLINKNVKIEKSNLVLWMILEYRYFNFLKAIKGNEYGNIKAMQTVLDQYKEDNKPLRDLSNLFTRMAEEKFDKLKLPDSLKDFFKDKELVLIIDKFRCSKEEFEELITLTSIVETTEDIKRKRVDKKRSPLDSMAFVPKGKFLYGEDKEEKTIDKDYEIDIYPVTNGRYKEFITAGGYTNKEYWNKAGWEWINNNNISHSIYMSDKDFNNFEQPVIGVSWYEADAFCRWMTNTRKDGHEYRLPKEEEWEKAARGDDGRVYPWGDEFDQEKCNTKESGIGKPTRVTIYPNGISPYGCYDMAGNVWEWTSSIYKKNRRYSILCGGSFNNFSKYCRCINRYFSDFIERSIFIGFRCVRIKP